MHELLAALGDAPFVFVVGKGGVGKTTAAGAIALALADAGTSTHLITTDPAESLSDLFEVPVRDVAAATATDATGATATDAGRRPSPCSASLTLEAVDARSAAERWLAPRRTALAEIIERGTYLETRDVDALLDLAMPGVDEAMGALRLVELAAARERGEVERIVVDTAPTGHTLRLLDAGSALTSWIAALRAMARKAAVVASSLLHTPVRLKGERILDDLERDLARLDALLHDAAFIVMTRPGLVVQDETDALIRELNQRRLTVSAIITTAPAPVPVPQPQPAPQIHAPLLPNPTGCTSLREWSNRQTPTRSPAVKTWLSQSPWRVIWFAGKGGVGKSTCAAAAALGLSEGRRVALHSTDPAGSLGALFGRPIGAEPVALSAHLRAHQVDARAAFDAWRAEYRADVAAVFERLGISESVALDRQVLESALDLAPLGMDEIVALGDMIDATERGETLIIDTAPTGHFLRLLEMPQLALDWTHALLRILLHHGAAGSLDDVSRRVLAFAKRLKVLRSTLADPERAAVFVVTLDEPMVRAETERLREALRSADIPEAAVLVNRAHAQSSFAASRVVRAPDCGQAPVGAAALRAFLDAWELV